MRKKSIVIALGLMLWLAASAYASRVTGQVVDSDGSPVAEVQVELSGNGNLYSAWTGEDGNFTIANVAEGSYRATVSGFDQAFEVKVDGSGMEPSLLVVDR